MKLGDFHTQEPEQKLHNLAKSLEDYGIDLSIYESLSSDELEMFLNDLENKKHHYVLESAFNSYYEDPEYTKLTMLSEALRIMLREISPKRKPKKLRPLIKENQEQTNLLLSVESNESTNEVHEDEEEMTENESKLKGLGDLVENTLLAEGELERAEVVLASRDIVTKMQGMIQDIGKMGTEDIMPMIDGIRNNFGPKMAAEFGAQTEQLIQSSADGLEDFKAAMEQWSSKFETRISDEDVQQPVSDMSDEVMGDGNDDSLVGAALPGDDMPDDDLSGLDNDEDLSDELGGDDSAAGEEPLGRAKKEEGRVFNLGGKKVKLTNEQALTLAKAKKIMERVKTLGSMTSVPSMVMLNTVIVDVHGKKVRLNEEQVKALVFAKHWKQLVEAKKAKSIRLSESQAKKIMLAKQLTEKFRSLVKPTKIDEKWKGDVDVKATGQWSKYTVAELEKKAKALRAKKDHTAAETKQLRQINFAIRSKRGWKGGAK